MKTFQDYAGYYDAIYKDKDYAQECDFLETVFDRHSARPVETILDLGCGTGGHSLVLAQRGYAVAGVDISEQMLTRAREKALAASVEAEFVRADIRRLSLGRSFDAVISMFAVISYQTTAGDVAAALKSIRGHLNAGGLFIFDIWFGPAVLAQKPEERTMNVDLGGGQSVVRKARPVLDTDKQTVEVNYNVTRFAGDARVGEIDESHLVRYFFPEEISEALAAAGFETLSISPFGSIEGTPSEESWNVTVVAKAI